MHLCVAVDICLAAGSDRTLQVFDMNAARRVRLMADVHTRPVHHIAQNHVRAAGKVTVGLSDPSVHHIALNHVRAAGHALQCSVL